MKWTTRRLESQITLNTTRIQLFCSMSTKGSSTTAHGSQLRDAQQLTKANLNQSWIASQVVIREAIKAYGSSITTGPERLIRYSAEGFTTDTVAAMTDLIESVMNMDRIDKLLNAADKIAAFHPKWQKLKDLESLWLGGHGDVQLTSPGTHYSTRQKAFVAVTSEFERYEQFAMAQCLDEYSKRPGPKIERKQDQDGSIEWENFEALRTVLQTICKQIAFLILRCIG